MKFTEIDLLRLVGRVLFVALSVATLIVYSCGDAKAWKPPTLAERAIVEHAIHNSPTARERYKDPFLMLDVLRLEEHPDIAVPEEFRGMSLAVSYRESRWSPTVEGDGGKAVGWTQMHTGHYRVCGRPDRTDPEGNMRCWLWRVRTTYQRKTLRRCVRREGYTERDAWVAAWRWVANGTWQGCEAGNPRLHWKQLLCWQDGVRRWVDEQGRRRSVRCGGRQGGWKGELSRYVAREYGTRTCNHAMNQGLWHAHE